MNTVKSKMVLLFNKLLLLFGIIFFLLSFISSLANIRIFFNSYSTVILLLLFSLCLLVVFYHLTRKYMSKKQFIFFLILVTLTLRLAWVLLINTQPFSDFLHMYSAAQLAEKGDFSFIYSNYFSRWPYQLGFTTYEALVIQFFGDHLLILKLLNIAYNIGTTLIIYYITSTVFNEMCGRIASFTYAIYIPNIIMSSVLTNQHISTFLFFLAFYLFIREKFWIEKATWLYTGLLFGIGNLMRPLGSFFLLGFIAYVLIYKFIISPKNNLLLVAKKTLGVLTIYFLVQQLFSYSLVAAELTQQKLANTEPYWKFMVGLNPHSNGQWTQQDTDYVLQFPIGKERDEAQLELFKERLEDDQLLNLFGRKFSIMWGGEDTSVIWSLMGMEKPSLMESLIQVERIGYTLLIFLGMISMILLFFSSYQHQYALFLIILLGYALIHFIIEIQTRYRFDVMPSIFILQSYSIYWTYQKFYHKQDESAKTRKKKDIL